ncbi:DUF6053 domain-containing protein [Lysobacter sp. CA199]|uniref:DUF6053 domain-containing protein n=1 Tax=Lysobacter sp. CA199 TaxID=3455608 RepID=UPI003F8CFB19
MWRDCCGRGFSPDVFRSDCELAEATCAKSVGAEAPPTKGRFSRDNCIGQDSS